MAKHRKPNEARSQATRKSRMVRGGVLAALAALCLAGSSRMFADAQGGTGNPASLRGAWQARLPYSGRWRHPAVSLKPVPRTAPAAASASASPDPTAQAVVTGTSVTAVGDSVMVASTPALQRALPGIYIDAMVGRQFSTGLQVIADLKAKGLLRPIVVVGLGTNGTVTEGEISQLLAEIGQDRKLVLVNTYEARPWEQEVNSTLAAAAAQHPGVVLANWYTTIEHRTSLLWPDGIHPQPAGTLVYARMLKAALARLASGAPVSQP